MRRRLTTELDETKRYSKLALFFIYRRLTMKITSKLEAETDLRIRLENMIAVLNDNIDREVLFLLLFYSFG